MKSMHDGIFVGFTYGIVLQSRDVGLHGLLHVAGGDQSGRQIDVAIDEVGLEANGPAIVLERLLQHAVLLVHVAEIAGNVDESLVVTDLLYINNLVCTCTCTPRLAMDSA